MNELLNKVMEQDLFKPASKKDIKAREKLRADTRKDRHLTKFTRLTRAQSTLARKDVTSDEVEYASASVPQESILVFKSIDSWQVWRGETDDMDDPGKYWFFDSKAEAVAWAEMMARGEIDPVDLDEDIFAPAGKEDIRARKRAAPPIYRVFCGEFSEGEYDDKDEAIEYAQGQTDEGYDGMAVFEVKPGEKIGYKVTQIYGEPSILRKATVAGATPREGVYGRTAARPMYRPQNEAEDIFKPVSDKDIEYRERVNWENHRKERDFYADMMQDLYNMLKADPRLKDAQITLDETASNEEQFTGLWLTIKKGVKEVLVFPLRTDDGITDLQIEWRANTKARESQYEEYNSAGSALEAYHYVMDALDIDKIFMRGEDGTTHHIDRDDLEASEAKDEDIFKPASDMDIKARWETKNAWRRQREAEMRAELRKLQAQFPIGTKIKYTPPADLPLPLPQALFTPLNSFYGTVSGVNMPATIDDDIDIEVDLITDSTRGPHGHRETWFVSPGRLTILKLGDEMHPYLKNEAKDIFAPASKSDVKVRRTQRIKELETEIIDLRAKRHDMVAKLDELEAEDRALKSTESSEPWVAGERRIDYLEIDIEDLTYKLEDLTGQIDEVEDALSTAYAEDQVKESEDIFKPASDEDVAARDAEFISKDPTAYAPFTKDKQYVEITCPHCEATEDHPKDEQRWHTQHFTYLDQFHVGESDYTRYECNACGKTFKIQDMFGHTPVDESEDIFKAVSKVDVEDRKKVRAVELLQDAKESMERDDLELKEGEEIVFHIYDANDDRTNEFFSDPKEALACLKGMLDDGYEDLRIERMIDDGDEFYEHDVIWSMGDAY